MDIREEINEVIKVSLNWKKMREKSKLPDLVWDTIWERIGFIDFAILPNELNRTKS